MKKRKQTKTQLQKLISELENKFKPTKQMKEKRKHWYKVRDKFERNLDTISKIKKAVVELLRNRKDGQ